MVERKVKSKTSQSSSLALHKLVPNMMTIAALIAGMTAIQYAIDERWERAVIAIVIAAFLDAFDGAAARLFNATSRLGAELDSLSDFLCFGVAPATIMYLWLLADAGKFGWITALVFTVAVALRLARFNAEEKIVNENAPDSKKPMFFKGVPAPTGAGMSLLPMIVSFEYMSFDIVQKFVTTPTYVSIWMLFFAVLMVSHIPTFSTKNVKLHPKLVVPVLALFGLMIVGLLHATWLTLTALGMLYALSVPFAYFTFLKVKQNNV